jgi:hypothetical protein
MGMDFGTSDGYPFALLVILTKNYENLMIKFNLLSKGCEEFKINLRVLRLKLKIHLS